MKPFIVAIVATFRRPSELQRLLDSLAAHAPEIRAVVVVDNGSSPEVQEIVARWPGQGTYLDPGKNLGCGGGLRLAGETAWSRYEAQMSHLAVLDDDAVVTEGAIARLLQGMDAAGAEAGCAMIVDAKGVVSWVPGLERHRSRRIEQQRLTPQEFIRQTSDRPIPFAWAQGICLLASHSLIARAGFHESNFWVRGEDLEYSLRLTAQQRGVWVPGAIVKHLPPPEDPRTAGRGEYLKHCAMLQNVAYVACRLPHGHRILWTLPSNLLRFLRTWGPASTGDAIRALWRGACQAHPAGEGSGQTFLHRSCSAD